MKYKYSDGDDYISLLNGEICFHIWALTRRAGAMAQYKPTLIKYGDITIDLMSSRVMLRETISKGFDVSP